MSHEIHQIQNSMTIGSHDRAHKDYLSGKKLYGDDFGPEELKNWYEDEELGYYNLVHDSSDDETEYAYGYSALNEHYAYRFIRDKHYHRALTLGCARGDDVEPISKNVGEFLALEPAEKWWRPTIGEASANFVKPEVSGDIICKTGSIDLTVCLGVLHHIPNVTHVINEIARVSKSGAIFVLREPVSTMGDWNNPRRGLTKNERGFPLSWLDDTLTRAGFEAEHRALCMFPATPRIGSLLKVSAYARRDLVILDKLFSTVTRWNYHYHRDKPFKKIAPANVFYVLRKK